MKFEEETNTQYRYTCWMECFSKMSIFNCATTTLFCLRNPTNLKKKTLPLQLP